MSGVLALPSTAAPATGLRACPSCRSSQLAVFHEQSGVPVHSCRLVDSRDEAVSFPQGRLQLALCAACGLITNTLYDASLQDYGVAYEETQGFSPRYRQFAQQLAQRWIDRYDLREKTVLEIGCGKGEFLALMCELGRNQGIGIDPAFVDERLESEARDRMRFITEVYADLPADAVVCRHTLEHISPVADFITLVRRTAGARDGTVVLFDLPDVVRVLREGAFWDIYYEHCSYFSPGSLGRLFRRSGFDVLSIERDYADQYLVIDARPGTGAHGRLPLEETVEELNEEVERFSRTFATTSSLWRATLADARAEGRRVAIWGAGSKAVAFLTTLATGDEVAYAVDINPFKSGKFVPGTGHPVLAPEALPAAPPDLVVVMNDLYLDEVRTRLATLGLGWTRVCAV
jgi:SAM-dependent methyltransferase